MVFWQHGLNNLFQLYWNDKFDLKLEKWHHLTFVFFYSVYNSIIFNFFLFLNLSCSCSVHVDQACLHLKHLCLMFYIGGKDYFLFSSGQCVIFLHVLFSCNTCHIHVTFLHTRLKKTNVNLTSLFMRMSHCT